MAIFSANKIINRVVTYLNANSFVAHNHWGDETTQFDQILQQVNHIYVFYDGWNPKIESNGSIRGRIFFQFWVIDQTMGTSSTKSDYAADLFRAEICSGSWKDFGIPTDYPNDNFEVFFLESETYMTIMDEKNNPTGRSIAIFKGYIDFHKSGLS